MSDDFRVEIWPPLSDSPGGQHVGCGPCGVRVTHIPSGLQAFCDAERSQHRNRAIAFAMLEGGVTSPHYRGPVPEGFPK